jgi:hypothetical protein
MDYEPDDAMSEAAAARRPKPSASRNIRLPMMTRRAHPKRKNPSQKLRLPTGARGFCYGASSVG